MSKIKTIDIYANLGILISLLFFPVSPFISIILFFIITTLTKKANDKTFYLFFFLLAIYLGLINSTKLPESDLINYYESFLEVENFSFFEYILLNGKEPVFFIFNYLSYYITGGNTDFYIIISTTIAYMFLFVAILKFFRAMNISKNTIVFAIILTAFFPQLFSLSAHLNRQFIAASILMFAMVQKIYYKKTVWPYLLIAVFTHSTAIFFVPLLYLKTMKRKFSLKVVIVLLIILSAISFIIPIIGEIISTAIGKNFLTYALIRAASGTSKELEPLGLMSFIVMGVLIFIVLLNQYLKNSKNDIGFMHFSNIFLIFSGFILFNLQMNELSTRFFFYTYFFFPFIFPLLIKSNKLANVYIRSIMSISMIFFFLYRIEYGSWEYAEINKLVFGNIFKYFIQ
ncbi:MAG: EpsG family protein [bacterium]